MTPHVEEREQQRPDWIVYKDRHLLVALKPAGMLAVADDSNQPALSDRVKDYYASRLNQGQRGYCEPMHQLDKVTSGLLLFALSGKAAKRIGDMFKTRRISKIYLAVVTGNTPRVGEKQHCEDYLAKVARQVKVVKANHPEAKRAELTCEVIAKEGIFTLLRVELHTGRTHQIRVQLAGRGWSIIGDALYGNVTSLPELSGIALHAQRLCLKHPVSLASLECEAPIPREWLHLWPRLLEKFP